MASSTGPHGSHKGTQELAAQRGGGRDGRDAGPSPAPLTKNGQIWVQLSSGMAASVVAAVVTTPFDVVKTRMQVSQGQPSTPGATRCVLQSGLKNINHSVGASVLRSCCILHPDSGGLVCNTSGTHASALYASSAAHDVHVPAHRANSFQTMMTITRTEGVGALWRGTGSNVATCIPSVGIYLVTYEQLKASITQHCGAPQVRAAAPLLAGGLARALSVIGTAPLELMRTRVMAQTGSTRALGGAGVLLRALTRGGWRSLWRGTVPTLYRDVPFSALYWMAAEFTRERLAVRWGMRRDAFSVNLVAGLVAGAAASVTTHPFDLVKTLAQVQDMDGDASKEARRGVGQQRGSLSTLAALRSVMATQGSCALWSGIGPRVLKVGPSCAIVLASYELFKSALVA